MRIISKITREIINPETKKAWLNKSNDGVLKPLTMRTLLIEGLASFGMPEDPRQKPQRSQEDSILIWKLSMKISDQESIDVTDQEYDFIKNGIKNLNYNTIIMGQLYEAVSLAPVKENASAVQK